jgi:hypothetical protein
MNTEKFCNQYLKDTEILKNKANVTDICLCFCNLRNNACRESKLLIMMLAQTEQTNDAYPVLHSIGNCLKYGLRK